MMPAVRGFCLAASLALLPTLAVVPQAGAASTPSNSAYVYIQIQGPAGAVYGFSASSAGQLSAIPGAPWKPAGQIVGATSSMLVTMGEDNLHSYGIASNGAIGSQLQQNPDTDYSGGACGGGSNGGAVLDHSGNYVYVLQQDGGACAAYQTFQILKNGVYNGVFNGDGYTEENTSGGFAVDLPSILGNESFAYADLISGHASAPIAFQRLSAGTLQLMQFQETDPTLDGGANYTPYRPDASPTGNYLVVQLFPYDSNPAQLGSYTVDSKGNISTTNTSTNMPTAPFENFSSTFSPSGSLFVIYADNGPNPGLGNGIEIYRFNGAAPLTPYQSLLNGTPIDQVAWDSSNHLYAISNADNTLYVFTVTPTSLTEDTSWSIGAPYKMIVVSK